MREALDRLDEGEEALRAQLMARLAMEVRYQPEGSDAAEALLAGSLELARRTDDVAARARTLEYATLLRWSARDPDEWIALSQELIGAAREAGDIDLVFRGILGLVTEYMQIGNRAGMEREIARCAELAERFPAPFQRASCSVMSTARNLLDGNFADAERGVQISLAANAPEATLPSLTQLFALYLDTGRIEQLEDQMLALHEQEPHRDSWKLALARMYVEVGRPDDARSYLAKTTRPDDMTRDRLWLPTVALVAEIVSGLGEKSQAAELIDLLEPFAALNGVYGRGTLYYGSVSHFLGMLWRTVGDLDRAETQLRNALRVHEAMQSPPWQLRTRVELAIVQANRGDGPVEPLEVAELRERASVLGMDSIVTRLRLA
jgi:tetratricopeptide (TPR) repeat protein